jgi:hypothetical protein
MNKAILWLLFIIAAACAWEDDKYVDINHCGECDVKCSPNQLCIDRVCTCPNNNNACTNSPNEPCGRCNAGQYCDLNSSGGTCTCLNNNNACGPTCTACLPGQHCESVNGGVTYQCICDNIPNSCGNGHTCTDCTMNGGVCSNGACACPQTSTACGLNGACTDCTQSNSICSNGACCSVTCATNGDCCAGQYCDTTSGTCITAGCFDLNNANLRPNPAFVDGSCGPSPFTQASCREIAGVYYSLTYNADDENPYCCIGYSSDYTFFPRTDGDQPCTPPQPGDAVYGRYTGTPFTFASPSSEYVFIA